MTFEESRKAVVAAINVVSTVFNGAEYARRMTDPASDIPLDELGLDSLEAMEFCIAVEDKTGIYVELGEVLQSRSLNGLARLLEKKSG